MNRILVGTEKGAYLIDEDRVTGPLFPGWMVSAFGRTPTGDHLAGVASGWFGTALYRSPDLETWHQMEPGPRYDGDRSLSRIWSIHTLGGRIRLGVAEAGAFTSDDDGISWVPVESLNEHPTREDWMPGAGGLCLHRFIVANGVEWAAISAVGVFRSEDGGGTWELKNDGVPPAGYPQDSPRPQVGYCVHGIADDPARPGLLWRQDHMGVFRSDDGGDSWQRIENGLPAGFGFVMHRDHGSGRLFVVPLASDENRLPVNGTFSAYLSDDDGDSWQTAGSGWPDNPTFTSVLRGAVAGDGAGTVVLGTTGGEVWTTSDAGDSWNRLEARFPRILAVALPDSPQQSDAKSAPLR